MVDNIVMENVEIVHSNFDTSYTPKGKRWFDVPIDDSVVKSLMDHGWDVNLFYASTIREFRLRINIDFDVNPRIYVVTKEGKHPIGPDAIDILGHIKIDNVDVCLKPYKFKVDSNKRIKACVSSMYITSESE